MTFYYLCTRNYLSLDTEQYDQTFTIKAVTANSLTVPIANSDVTPLETEANCPLTRTLEIYDPEYHIWVRYDSTVSAITTKYPWITVWTAPTGSFPYTVSSNDFEVDTDQFDDYSPAGG